MINKDRLAVIIGKNGMTKKIIQTLTNTIIEIDSTTGEYTIHSQDPSSTPEFDVKKFLEQLEISVDSLQIFTDSPNFGLWTAKNIIEAINIGFNPEKAFRLVNQNYIFEKISLEDAVGTSQKAIKRIKGRIIGENGSMRQSIEKFSLAFISIYGNFVGFIADFDSLKIAQKAVDMILEGLPHKTVTAFLQKRHRERKEKEFHETWKPTFD